MQIAMIGLGRMGGNMVERLLRGGHQVVGCDIPKQQKVIDQYVAKGAIGVTSWEDAVAKLQKPRVVWLMLPSRAARGRRDIPAPNARRPAAENMRRLPRH